MLKNGPILLLILALAAGCTPAMRGDQFVDPSAHELDSDLVVPTTQPTTQPAEAAKPAEPQFTKLVPAQDAMVLIRPQVNLSVYHLAVPAGSVSRGEAFWKRIDENVLDIGTRDILQKNGLRAGVAPMRDMREIMAQLTKDRVETSPAVFVTHTVKAVELPMKQALPEQTIYHFDARDNLAVRTYDRCDNIFMLEFQPAPRKAGDVRLALCPMVRTLRRQVRAVGDDDGREIEIYQPEKLYDVGMKLDLPADSFLVLAPSVEARSSMSVGNAFLMHNAAAERLEGVLVIIPQAIVKPAKPAEARAEGAEGSNTRTR